MLGFKKLSALYDTFRNFPQHLNIWMTTSESNLFLDYCNKSSNLLEFGCGGSTNYALDTQIKNIFSVESDILWINKLKKYKKIKKAIKASRLNLFHADIGEVGFCGVPCNLSQEDFSAYHTQPFLKLGKDKCRDIDIVLIDGRFRVACAMQTILYCNPNVVIAMHDYSMRPEYYCIEKFLDKVDSIDSFAIFKIRKDILKADVADMFLAYAKNCD